MTDFPVPLNRRDIVRVFDRKLPPYFTRDEVNEILQANTHDPRAHLVVNTLWKTGVRVSELCALRKKDLDPYGKAIRVVTLKQGPKREKNPDLEGSQKPHESQEWLKELFLFQMTWWQN